MSDRTPAAVRVRPVQLVPVTDGVIIKRGRMEFKVAGKNAYDFVRSALELASRGLTSAEIAESSDESNQGAVGQLFEHLEQRGLLEESSDQAAQPETSLDLFYWSAGRGGAGAAERTTDAKITVVGVNEVSRTLVGCLIAAGHTQIEVVNYHFLCNLRLLDESGRLPTEQWPTSLPTPVEYSTWTEKTERAATTDNGDSPRRQTDVLVATSDFGGLALMRTWNEYCVKDSIPFLPVVLQDLVGYLGPLYVPGETACFECARARQNANLTDRESVRATESLAFVGQGVTAAFHPALPGVLGNLAALEVSRFVGQWGIPRTLGTLVEVDLLAPELVGRPVLKLPRCRVCGQSAGRSTTELFRTNLLPGTSGHYE